MKPNEVVRRQFSDKRQSWFSHYYAGWAVNHRGWQKMKKKNKKSFKKKFRDETKREVEQELKRLEQQRVREPTK